MGISLKQIRAESHTLLTDNPRTSDTERWRSEVGLESITILRAKIDSNSTYQSRIEIRSLWSPQPLWTALWDTEFIHRIRSIIELRLNVQLNYDQQQSKRLQYRQSFALGIALPW
ncbi:MAG: hypothetical protein N2663_00455 [Chlorobi bacterium]|nr:hypothetical protein [Chlorobiota bacterium]